MIGQQGHTLPPQTRGPHLLPKPWSAPFRCTLSALVPCPLLLRKIAYHTIHRKRAVHFRQQQEYPLTPSEGIPHVVCRSQQPEFKSKTSTWDKNWRFSALLCNSCAVIATTSRFSPSTHCTVYTVVTNSFEHAFTYTYSPWAAIHLELEDKLRPRLSPPKNLYCYLYIWGWSMFYNETFTN